MSRQIHAVCLKCFFFLVLLLSVAVPTIAQSSAALSGLVQDTSDAVIPNADVKLINTATGTESNSRTNKSGSFVLPSVMPGHYTLQIEREGFDTTQLTGITLNVGDNKSVVIRMKVGSTNQTVTVDGSGLAINTTDASVSTVVDRKFVANMPLNGRSFQDLISMTPGVVTQSPQAGSSIGSSGDFSVNGQRTESNYYTVDGISANIGAASGYGEPSPGSSGSLSATTALGTTQSMISVDALQEFRVESSTYSAQYGRNPGGQFSLATRSGTNEFHGAAFEYLRNDALDANDWFNNYYGDPKPALRQNDFGGTLGGPVSIPLLFSGRDRLFFFVSYEGLRLTQPQAASVLYVPDANLRETAPSALQPILNAFPVQNGTDYPSSGLAEFIEPYSIPSRIDSTSVRLDYALSPKSSIFFRFGNTPTSSEAKATSSASNLSKLTVDTRTYTAGITSQISSRLANQFRIGYAGSTATTAATLDSFGGATPINLAQAIGLGSYASPSAVFQIYDSSVGEALIETQNSYNQNRQWNITDSVDILVGKNSLKFGIDYRRVNSPFASATPEIIDEFLSSSSVLANSADYTLALKFVPASPLFNEFSAYAQDEWRVSRSVSLSTGLRWEVNPPPTGADGDDAYTLLGNINQPASLVLAPQGTRLWKTTWLNLAPRLGVAWTAHDAPGRQTVVRAGGGVFFDTGNQLAAYGFNAIGFESYAIYTGQPVPTTPSQLDFPVSAAPPYTSASIYAYPEHLQLPYTLQWNVSLEQALTASQAVTFAYVGSNGRRLLQQQQLYLNPYNSNLGTVYYIPNGVTSNYQALQVKFQRTVSRGIQALASYTWSHSIDFGSNNAALPLTRGNSDFDVRNNFQAGLSWDIPERFKGRIAGAALGGWGLDGRLIARTGFPVTLQGNYLTDPTSGSQYYSNVTLVPNEPIYLYGPHYPGGRAINPAAFTLPNGSDLGNAPRNFVRGFGEEQINVAARRTFALDKNFSLQFRAEAFNILNHPNFGYIDPALSDAQFGLATQMLNGSLGTTAAQYQQGGPRSMQFALKLQF